MKDIIKKRKKIIIGRVEKISLPAFGIKSVHAKIDTGADLSTIWATGIKEVDDTLRFKLFGRGSPHYRSKTIEIKSPDYILTRVASSFGHTQLRYVVKLQIKVKGKLIKGTFTLSDREKKTYPILIGRKLLQGKFLVDVGRGSPLKKLEEEHKKRMKKELEVFDRWEKKS